MKSSDRFDINNFISPDISYSPVYVWVWNDVCNYNIIDEQLTEMQNLGIRSFYILAEPINFRPDSMPTNLSPDYLSNEFFELCAYAIKKAEQLDMRCWIYDEGGWPSGSACGKIIKDHPEFAREILKFKEIHFSSGETYKKSSSDILAGFINKSKMIEEGYIFTVDSIVTEYFTTKEICCDTDYPDLLNKSATEYFIETTHEKYSEVIKNSLGKTITAVFTDEPKASLFSFNEDLNKKYEDTYNESIIPFLPLIAKQVEVTKETAYILQRWYDLCSKMFCENFLLPCKKWANEHNIAFTGHLDMDHSPDGCIKGGGNFNLMRALRCFDIPGIDIIWRQLYPENKIQNMNNFNGYNGFFPRYASSVARQNGTKLAMSEIFGVAGPALTYDIMRFTVGYQAVCGINIFNPFNFPLGRKGALLAQELPIFTENQIYYRYLNKFNRYTERLSYLATLGERVCETALYYPISDFQGGINSERISKEFDFIGRTLEDMLIDFDIIDDDIIQDINNIKNGALYIGDAIYNRIIIPENAYIPAKTQKALNHFVEVGGKVLHNISNLKPIIDVDETGLRVSHRKIVNGDLLFLFREKGENDTFHIQLPATNGYLLNLENGELNYLQMTDSTLEVSLQTGETAVLLLTDEVLEAKKDIKFNQKIKIRSNFMFHKELELVCDENGFNTIKHSDTSTPVKLGDWSYLVGDAYSGSCVYETTFPLSEDVVGKTGEINLNKVDFIAEVFLNKIPLGTALMPPYKFKIPANILQKENTLKIIVTNTPANWYVKTDYFDKWKEEELSPYFKGEIEYAKDFVSGGLYGPVTLYTNL